MTFDKLPIEGDLPVNKQNIIYFSCNPKYWVEYGQYLAKSTLYYNHHQVHVHVHIMYEQEEHNPKNYISDPGITYTFERHPKDFYDQFRLDTKNSLFARGMEICNTRQHEELKQKIYWSSRRFMIMDKLFGTHQHVLQLDADGLCRVTFALHHYQRITKTPSAMRKPKERTVYIASCLSPGIGQEGDRFKQHLAQQMTMAFQRPIYWFVDQHVLKQIFDAWDGSPIHEIPYGWNSWGLKSGGEIFSTAKGTKKYGTRYKNLKYNWFTDKQKLKFHKDKRKKHGKS